MKNSTNNGCKFASIISAAAIMAVSVCASFVAVNNANSNTVENTLNHKIDTAVSAVTHFEDSLTREKFLFSDELYSLANIASAVVTDKSTDEEVEKIAGYLDLDSVIVTDSEGNSVAAYPSDLKGINIKDNEETSEFVKVLKGISFKTQSEPVVVDESTASYTINTCVGRANGQGVVIIKTTEDYSKLFGFEIANDCSDNTLVVSGDNIISSSFSESDKTSLTEMGITDDNLKGETFTLEVNNTSYNCKADSTDNFTVISFVSSDETGVDAATVLLITLVADIVALAIIVVISFVFKKKAV